ncbi:hypothetical protein BFJ68_g15005 [Fusarium oxysporum]|uniref:Uncharacterized protein n=2 Tax=Fusarium oxysporum TaxID=5507 RepID=A0A420NVH7_FUSOX|nr:hypothetical protein FOZG_13654 [Fusarium oxysporum Fo47]RKK84226.1 hypothetical protein BFJ71_g14609 [Fusarium oxysporum]RKK94967.1 hypothetical protein BFJ68_g15005 [Fusarium oxysporum]
MEIREQDQYDTLNGWRVVDAAAIRNLCTQAPSTLWDVYLPHGCQFICHLAIYL